MTCEPLLTSCLRLQKSRVQFLSRSVDSVSNCVRRGRFHTEHPAHEVLHEVQQSAVHVAVVVPPVDERVSKWRDNVAPCPSTYGSGRTLGSEACLLSAARAVERLHAVH